MMLTVCLSVQMEGVIQRLIASAFGTDLNPKIISCLQAYRCVLFTNHIISGLALT